MSPWWSAFDGALFGAIGGSIIGVAGGILGAAAGVLAPRGKGRRIVLGTYFALMATGTILLIAGVYAVASGQPYHVWYPLVLIGGILALVLSLTLPAVRHRYRQAEVRRMDAEEFRRM